MSTKPTNPKDAIATDKLPLGLCPDTLQEEVCMAFLEGALKYGRYNWRVAGVRASIYHDALKGHLSAWWNGEDIDPDSGLHHLAKAGACIAILLDAMRCGKLTDDRPPRAPVQSRDVCSDQVKALREKHKGRDPHQYTIANGPNVLHETFEPQATRNLK